MKRILEFDDFIDNLSLTAEEQAEIRQFMHKYSKYSEFHDDAQFLDSADDITNDVMRQFNFPESKRDDVKNYLSVYRIFQTASQSSCSQMLNLSIGLSPMGFRPLSCN